MFILWPARKMLPSSGTPHRLHPAWFVFPDKLLHACGMAREGRRISQDSDNWSSGLGRAMDFLWTPGLFLSFLGLGLLIRKWGTGVRINGVSRPFQPLPSDFTHGRHQTKALYLPSCGCHACSVSHFSNDLGTSHGCPLSARPILGFSRKTKVCILGTYSLTGRWASKDIPS